MSIYVIVFKTIDLHGLIDFTVSTKNIARFYRFPAFHAKNNRRRLSSLRNHAYTTIGRLLIILKRVYNTPLSRNADGRLRRVFVVIRVGVPAKRTYLHLSTVNAAITPPNVRINLNRNPGGINNSKINAPRSPTENTVPRVNRPNFANFSLPGEYSSSVCEVALVVLFGVRRESVTATTPCTRP